MLMVRKGVFKIINKRTGRVYVGSSNTNLDKLIYNYWQRLYSGDHHNPDLQADFDSFGKSNFTVEIVSASCYSEDEVRSLREHEIYINRHNTYNEDVPVHYGGGNYHGSFGGYHAPRHNVIDDLIGIIDKSNINFSYKRTLKSDVKNGKITNKIDLNNKIRYYKELPTLSDILNKSDLNSSEKEEIRLKIDEGNITTKNQLNDMIAHYQRVGKLVDILNKSKLKQSYKEEILSHIENGEIKNEIQLNDKINFYVRLSKLLSILERTNIKPQYKNVLRTDIRKGNIISEYKLNEEIKVYQIMGKYDYNTLRKLCNQYCSFSAYSSWTQKMDKIIFENSEQKTQKEIHIDSLQNEIDSLRHNRLFSPLSSSKLKFNLYEIIKIISDALNFKSFDLYDGNTIIFDNEFRLDINDLEFLYHELNLTKDNKFRISESAINNCLNKTIYGVHFSNSVEKIIIEYCEIKKIRFWDLINLNNSVLFYEKYLRIFSIDDLIGSLDEYYKEFNLKLGPLNLKNIYHVIKRHRNKPDDGDTTSVKELLNILSKSDLTITNKIELKEDINKGNINTKKH